VEHTLDGAGTIAPPTIWLRTVLAKNGLQASDQQLGQIDAFVGYLLDWNSKVNLISRKDTENIWRAHILHSASVLLLFKFQEGSTLLDLGSGGGLPGVVIKILRPDLIVTCLDSTRKKMDAVSDMIGRLGLTGCYTAWGRAEVLGKIPPLAASFDIIVARAVAPLRDLALWSRPFLRHSSATRPHTPTLVALKGGEVERECAQTKALPGVASVRASALQFAGSEEIPGVDKKAVIVEFD